MSTAEIIVMVVGTTIAVCGLIYATLVVRRTLNKEI